MDLFEFNRRYPDEHSCIAEFKRLKLEKGMECNKCGGTDFRWRRNDLRFECCDCQKRQSIRCGTVLQNSKLPFRYWFFAVCMLTNSNCSRNITAHELQIRLEHNRYEPILNMKKKLDVLLKGQNLTKLPEEILSTAIGHK